MISKKTSSADSVEGCIHFPIVMSTMVPAFTLVLKASGNVRAYPFLIGVIDALEATQPVLQAKS